MSISDDRAVTRTSFGDAVKALLGTRSIKWLASECRESPNSMRNWLNRNRLPREVFERIAVALGKDVEELARDYPPQGWTTSPRIGEIAEPNRLLDSIEAYESKRTKVKGQLRGLSGVVPTLYASMRSRDIVVFTSVNVVPFEFDPAAWNTLGIAVCDALRSGAYFVYLFPDHLAASKWQDTWGVDVRLDELRNHCDQFRKRVLHQLKDQGLKAAQSVLDKQFVTAMVSSSPFWFPSATLAYHQTFVESTERMGRFSIRVPSDIMGIFLLPQHSNLERTLRHFVGSELKPKSLAARQRRDPSTSWCDPPADSITMVRSLLGIV